MSSLFRPQVLQTKSPKFEGSILLVSPLQMRFAAWISIVISVGILMFLIFGEYTKTVKLNGQIVPDTGAINVIASQAGRVIARHAQDGAIVNKGDLLFEITSDRKADGPSSDAEVDRLIEKRRGLLHHEGELQFARHELKKSSVALRIPMIEEELRKIRQEIAAQELRIASASNMRDRFRALRQNGYSTAMQVSQMENDYNDQISRKRSLERNAIALRRDLQLMLDELSELDSQQKILIAQSNLNLVALAQESTEHLVRTRAQIAAPTSGTVGTLTVELGESVDAGRVLATIVPAGSTLIAQLMAPSHSVGALEIGQMVFVRLDAFPYQKYGAVKGKVARVDRTPILNSQPGREKPESFYRVVVVLEKKLLVAQGRYQYFKVGMSLEADIKQDRRTLIQWILDPLLSVTKDHSVT